MKYQNWIYNLFGCCKGYERKAFKLTSILENKFYTKKTMAKNIALGLILVGIAIIFLISISIFKLQINSLTNALMVESGGTCIIEGKCLHEKSNTPVYIGVAITFVTLSLGLYLIFFEKGQKYTEEAYKEIANSLKESKKKENKDEKFNFLLKALNDDEKNIMTAIRDQNGIEQATLRIRTDLSKTKLSVLLSELEKKGLLKKVAEGKKNKVYLKMYI